MKGVCWFDFLPPSAVLAGPFFRVSQYCQALSIYSSSEYAAYHCLWSSITWKYTVYRMPNIVGLLARVRPSVYFWASILWDFSVTCLVFPTVVLVLPFMFFFIFLQEGSRNHREPKECWYPPTILYQQHRKHLASWRPQIVAFPSEWSSRQMSLTTEFTVVLKMLTVNMCICINLLFIYVFVL